MPHVAQIFLYPVKSLRGFPVERAAVDALGIVGDRRFLVVDPAGGFLTQRSVPRMATIATALTCEALRLSAPDGGSIDVSLRATPGVPPQLRTVAVWQSSGLTAEDCGERVADWLTAALGTPARLVRAGAAFRRPVPLRKLPSLLRAARPARTASVLGAFPPPSPVDEVEGDSAHEIAFPDAYPFMVLGDATLAELNGRLAAQGDDALPIQRFRPSFVVTGAEPYAEDHWRRFLVGDLAFFAGGPCTRCIVTNTDPWTGDRGLEPLRLLSTYRRDAATPAKINFGQNALHAGKPGAIAVGDPITVLESEA